MILKIKCPECNQNLTIYIKKDQVVSVEFDGTIKLSDDEIKNVLNSLNIEFG